MATVGVFAAISDDEGRLLFVRRAYGDHGWGSPGGLVEPGECPLQALVREVQEETGFTVSPGALIGVYAKPFADDLVLWFRAEVLSRGPFPVSDEISEMNFFGEAELPDMIRPIALVRVRDAFAGDLGLVRTFASAEIDAASVGSHRKDG